MNDQAEEISVEELFRELCVRGRDYVTVKDIKKWDYLQELMKVIDPRSAPLYLHSVCVFLQSFSYRRKMSLLEYMCIMHVASSSIDFLKYGALIVTPSLSLSLLLLGRRVDRGDGSEFVR